MKRTITVDLTPEHEKRVQEIREEHNRIMKNMSLNLPELTTAEEMLDMLLIDAIHKESEKIRDRKARRADNHMN